MYVQSWDVNLLYYGRHRKSNCDELGAGYESDLYTFLGKCDVITINVPLTDKTRQVPGLPLQACVGFEAEWTASWVKCDIVTINVPLTDKTRRAAADTLWWSHRTCKAPTFQAL